MAPSHSPQRPPPSPRRRQANSPRRPARSPARQRGSPRSTGPAPQPPQRPSSSDVATWTHQAGTEAPVAFASWRPWRRQERARVGMAPERLFQPFQGRTVADADRAAEGASLPLPLGTRLCGCGAVMLHPCHRTGPLLRTRTQAAGASSSAAAPPPPPPQGPGGTAAEFMVRRAAQEPEFALWLLQVATATPPPRAPRRPQLRARGLSPPPRMYRPEPSPPSCRLLPLPRTGFRTRRLRACSRRTQPQTCRPWRLPESGLVEPWPRRPRAPCCRRSPGSRPAARSA
ncbi:uncharacterized protein LOC144170876 [Haemaphysalis longicornis]